MKHTRLSTRPLCAATLLLCAGLTAAAQVPQQKMAEAMPASEAAQTLILQGVQFVAAGRYAEAVGVYDRALRLAPNDAVIYNNLGCTYAKLERFAEAAATLNRAIALKPDFADAHYNLGRIYGKIGLDGRLFFALRGFTLPRFSFRDARTYPW